MTSPLVQLKDVDLTVGEKTARVHVLKSINLSISHGETLGIVGPSGSGKSTLLMVIAGLERIDEGEITIENQRIDQMSEDMLAKFRGKHIGIVFQSFNLVPTMTALENTAVPLELRGQHQAMAIAEKQLRAVGLGDRLHHFPNTLSGGEQQRVAIARALAPNPELIIADEPTGNLDSETGAVVADLIFEKVRARGLSLILVTHDPVLAARCQRQIHVKNGRIVDQNG